MVDSPDRPRRPGGPPPKGRSGSARPAKGTPPTGGMPDREGKPREGYGRDAQSKRDGAPYGGPKRDGGSGRPGRSSDKPAWQKRDGDRPARPSRDGDRPARPGRDGDRPARPSRDGQQRDGDRRGGRPQDSERRLWTRDGAPAHGDSSARERETPEDRDPYGTKSVRARHDAPEIPEDILPNQLDRVARAQLKTLSKENADEVARHLIMAAQLIDEDPELAHLHAVSAGRRAGRIAVVRETLAITAYSIGDFALALRELRTYRRISGRDDQLPMMVDCERGLGRPEKALELGRSVPRASLPTDVQVELAIAMSGARLDLGQTDAALVELQIPQLDPDTAYPWSPALFDAYATVLEDLGRADEAKTWFGRSEVATAALSSGDEEDTDEIEVFEEVIEGEDDEESTAPVEDEVGNGAVDDVVADGAGEGTSAADESAPEALGKPND